MLCLRCSGFTTLHPLRPPFIGLYSGNPHPPLSSLSHGDFRDRENEKSYTLKLAPSGRTLLICDVPDASPTASSHPQFCQRSLCHGLFPLPVSSCSRGATSARTVSPMLERRQLVIDHAVTWVPHLPEQPLPAATCTPQRIPPCTGQHALTRGLLRHDAIRPLDQPTQRHHQRCEHPLHLLGFAWGMQTIIAKAMEPFGQNMLHHAPNERQRRDLLLLPLLGLVIVLPIAHPLPIVAQDASQGDRGTHHVLRQGVCQAFPASWHLPLLPVRHQALGIRTPQDVDLGFERARAHPLLQHGAEVIRPLLVQPCEGEVVHFSPLLLRCHPA